MIVEYHRPENLQDALTLLKRKEIKTVPLGGGSVLNAPSAEKLAVVDLQALDLDRVQMKGSVLFVGATVTLQSLLDRQELPEKLAEVIRHEASYNLRQVATVAGTLVSADGRSPFANALLALDVQLTLLPGEEQVGAGDLLFQRPEILVGRLITGIQIPVNARFGYEYVARTPLDLPIVCVAGAAWPSGRTRVSVGGYGTTPALVLDGPEPGGVELAASDVYHQAEDEWATSEYRREMAAILAKRCINSFSIGD